MATSSISGDDIRRMAAEVGLDKLSAEQLEALRRATEAARARRARLPVDDLTYADEPAHVFSLGDDS